MRSRWLINLGLAILVAGLVLLAWRKPGLEPAPQHPALTDIDPAQVQAITIASNGEERLHLVRDGATWRLDRPVTLKALGYRVDSLLELLSTERFATFPLPDEATLTKYGLTDGRPEVTFDDLTVRFGDQNPVAIRRYVAIGDQGYLIDDHFHHHATAPWHDWADRRLLPEEAVITALQLPGFSLLAEQGTWEITPDNGAGADALNRFVDGWKYAYAMSVGLPDEPHGGEPIRISWHAGDDETIRTLDATVQRGAQGTTSLVVPALGVAYRFTAETTERLLNPPRAEPAPTEPTLDEKEHGATGAPAPAEEAEPSAQP
ncbi:MAG: DUF4340 domain-containing protein [Pseudomonadota bacterium]|nr:DUF4340 domain-containing protein [Pseudomonadota bacterium]